MNHDDETVDFSPYASVIELDGSPERPKHNNWVVPHGTALLVDFDAPIKAAVLAELRSLKQDVSERPFMLTGLDVLDQHISKIEFSNDR